MPPDVNWSMPLDALPDPEPSDYEFAVAILERLRTFAPILTDGLVDTLGRCDKRTLLMLFGMASGEIAPDPEPEPPAPERELLPHERWPKQVPDNGQSSWAWNDRGERQQRLPSSFPQRDPYSGGSHWSR